MPPKKVNKSHKIALYIRVSTEEQASNPEGSIKNQEQRLRACVDYKNSQESFGKVSQVFVDRAKSGKNTNRPQLQKLLQAIEKREITLVMVTEISRLSRSLKDFCDIWDLMKKNNCEFQSLREQFDTTTAAGEMVLLTVANIAQFERKQCSERVSANFLSRAKRGLFNGGGIPLGYDRHVEKRGYLQINKEEAKIVKEVFSTFLREGSLALAAKSLNKRELTMPRKKLGCGNKERLSYFTVGNLHLILKNKSYIGLKTYKVGGQEKTSKACWELIINENIFYEAQKLLKRNYRRLKKHSNRRYPYLLSGITTCGSCGDRLPGKSAHGNGGKIPYYEHGWAVRRQACLTKKVFQCKPHRILAKKLEPDVWDQCIDLLNTPKRAKEIVAAANEIHLKRGNITEADRLKRKVRDIELQIEALTGHLAKIPANVSPMPIYTQMAKLETAKKNVEIELQDLMDSQPCFDVPVPLQTYENYLKTMSRFLSQSKNPEFKTKVVQKLIHKVEVLPNGFDLHYFAGEAQIRKFNAEMNVGEGKTGSSSLGFIGSNTLLSGWGARIRT